LTFEVALILEIGMGRAEVHSEAFHFNKLADNDSSNAVADAEPSGIEQIIGCNCQRYGVENVILA